MVKLLRVRASIGNRFPAGLWGLPWGESETVLTEPLVKAVKESVEEYADPLNFDVQVLEEVESFDNDHQKVLVDFLTREHLMTEEIPPPHDDTEEEEDQLLKHPPPLQLLLKHVRIKVSPLIHPNGVYAGGRRWDPGIHDGVLTIYQLDDIDEVARWSGGIVASLRSMVSGPDPRTPGELEQSVDFALSRPDLVKKVNAELGFEWPLEVEETNE